MYIIPYNSYIGVSIFTGVSINGYKWLLFISWNIPLKWMMTGGNPHDLGNSPYDGLGRYSPRFPSCLSPFPPPSPGELGGQARGYGEILKPWFNHHEIL